MIKTVKKNEQDVLNRIPRDAKIGIIGCGDCSAVLGTGGTKQVEAWTETLKGRNPVLFAVVIESPCDQRTFRRFFQLLPNAEALEFVLLLACPAGGQSVAGVIKKAHSHIQVVMGLEGQGPGWIENTSEKGWHPCFLCKTCRHEFSGTTCPVSACPLKKQDGPCQNRLPNDHCAYQENMPCSWTISTDDCP